VLDDAALTVENDGMDDGMADGSGDENDDTPASDGDGVVVALVAIVGALFAARRLD
jgi:hypothetical protein